VTRTRAIRVLALAAALLVVAACGSDDDDAPAIGRTTSTPATTGTSSSSGRTGTAAPETGDLAAARVKATRVAEADDPTALTARAGSDVLYVAERAGTIRTLRIADDGTGTLGDQPVLDLTGQTTTDSERGLLGVAFSEDGSTLFASYTNRQGDTRVDAYAMRAGKADVSTRRQLLAVDQPFANHNGGDIMLGPDGKLWLGLGDGGAGGDPGNRAQDPTNPLGKLLRLDPDGDGSQPPDIWAIGLRNPWRFSFDRVSHELWIGDVGQDAWEEIDVLPADTKPGTNFGWSGYEGTHVYDQDRVTTGTVSPVHEMSHQDGWCAVTGGVVYRGTRIPDLRGAYLFGDYCKPGLHALTLAGGKVTLERDLGVDVASLVSIDEDAQGEVYLLSLDGGISRLAPA
jgi:glucose/arabinose dehydrogenase